MRSSPSIPGERRLSRPLLLERLEGRVVPSFLAARAFDAGSAPGSVAVGEFNGDGRLDLAVVNDILNGTMSVLLGNGDGAFQTPRSFSVGGRPSFVAVGDVNGDGRLDLAVTASTVRIFLGNGDGTFQAAQSFAAGVGPRSVAIRDVNGDGRLDLAVANWDSWNVSVLLGNGDGTFQTARNFSGGRYASSVAAGDVNGDGRLDLAVEYNGALPSLSAVSVLLGNGDGAFQNARNFLTGGTPRSVALGDLNGDSRLDLVTGAVILLGNGDGTFRAATNHGGAGFRAVADVNEDGRLDLVTTGSVLLGNGDGTFQAARIFHSGSSPWSVAVGDVNADGRLDVAVANRGTRPDYLDGSVSVLLGIGDGSFQSARPFAAGSQPRSVAVGDVNGDTRLDLAVAGYGRECVDPKCTEYQFVDETVRVLLGNGDGTFQAARDFAAGRQPSSVAVGDINGDGRLDLAVANSTNFGSVSVLVGNGDGSFQTGGSLSAGGTPTSVAVADVNGDGRLDLAVANVNSANLSVLLGNGDGTFQTVRNFPAGSYPIFVAVGDVNGDGRLDLAAANYLSVNVRVLLGNGDGTFQAPRSIATTSSSRSMAVGDVNVDGRLDLAVAHHLSNSVSVLLGNGDGSFQAARTFPAGRVPSSVAVADVNGDGRPDLAVANLNSGTVNVLLGNGDGTFQTTVSYAAGSNPSSVSGADLDGDGWLDVVTANSGSNDVTVLLNDAYWGGPAVYFYVYPDSGTVPAGQPFDVFVIPLNASFEIVTNYTGQVYFYPTDPLATTPVYYRFQLSDHGIAAFPGGLTFNTLGLQELYVFDLPAVQVWGYAAFNVVGAGPGRAGGRAAAALDLFVAQELSPPALVRRPPDLAVFLPVKPRHSESALGTSGLSARPAATAGTSPAARLDQSEAILDHLYTRLDEQWLTA